MNETIEVTKEGRVTVIRLNRPDQLNALNAKLAQEVVAAAEAAARDEAVGCILLSGGEKIFAAGADIAEMSAMSADDVVERDFFSIWDRFAQVRTPKVAAVNGYALGGGCEIMMMCNFAIAGQRARFGQPEIKLGIVAGMGGTQRMTRMIGRARSADLHLTGRLMDAEEALASGLVARVVPDEKVLKPLWRRHTSSPGSPGRPHVPRARLSREPRKARFPRAVVRTPGIPGALRTS